LEEKAAKALKEQVHSFILLKRNTLKEPYQQGKKALSTKT
jgi:hypothetical protein